MYFCDDISERMIFDQVSDCYLEARPEYPDEVYEYISKLIFQEVPSAHSKTILEVGCGSGQATQKLEKWSKYLACIEPGENFVRLLNQEFGNNSNVEVFQTTFEDFISEKRYDLIFSGCALHWIPKNLVLSKSVDLLEKGGWLVGAWNMPQFESGIYHIIEKVVHPVYREFDIPRGTQEQIDYFQVGLAALVEHGGFSNCKTLMYYSERHLSPEMLVKLIWSYMNISEVGVNNSDALFMKLQNEVSKLGLKKHIVKNIYPVAFAQKSFS